MFRLATYYILFISLRDWCRRAWYGRPFQSLRIFNNDIIEAEVDALFQGFPARIFLLFSYRLI